MISNNEVKHIAKLARLGLKENEAKKFESGLSSILDYFAILEKTETKKIEPTFHPTENFLLKEKILRKDEHSPELFKTADRLIESAPDKKGRCVKVKAIL